MGDKSSKSIGKGVEKSSSGKGSDKTSKSSSGKGTNKSSSGKGSDKTSKSSSGKGTNKSTVSPTMNPTSTPKKTSTGCKKRGSIDNGVSDNNCAKCTGKYKWWPCNSKKNPLCEGTECVLH